MQTINVLCVGKLKENYFKDACSEYIKRLGAFCKINIIEIKETKLPENPKEAEISFALKAESTEIMKHMSSLDSFNIALCIDGCAMTSEELAMFINKKAGNGISKISFIIGSSYGLHRDVIEMADYRLSFSAMTYPHQLMRVILLEQVYRAYTIIANRRYHK